MSIIAISVWLLLGCSGKYPAMKTGALVGGITITASAIAVGTKDTNSDYAGAIAVVVIILGLAGTALGAGVGYAVDTIKDDEIQSQNIVEIEK